MTTKFSEKFKTKTDSELLEIIDNASSYQNEALITAIFELESRGISNDDTLALKRKMEAYSETAREEEKQIREKNIPANIPDTILNASKAIYLTAILGIINPLLVDLLTYIDNFSNPSALMIILISTSLMCFFGFYINKGKKWARDVFTVLFGLGLLGFPSVITQTFQLHTVIGILSLLQVGLQGYAVLLLFKPDSRDWYESLKLIKNRA